MSNPNWYTYNRTNKSSGRTSGKSRTNTFTGDTRAQITDSDTKGWVLVFSPFDQKFVDELKSTIQPSHRIWDPAIRAWKINDMFVEDMIVMCKRYFKDVILDVEDKKTNNAPAKIDNVFTEVFKILPDDTVKKIYSALAFALHPDHGGSEEQMKKLNLAFEERSKGIK